MFTAHIMFGYLGNLRVAPVHSLPQGFEQCSDVKALIMNCPSISAPTKCDPNPCMNGATCRPAPQSLVGYKCTCLPGYEGVNCEDGETE